MTVKNDMDAEEAATERRLAAIMAQDPDLRVKRLSIHRSGHDSVALDINDALICKFPRNALATRRLRREVRILDLLRGKISLPVPQMSLHPGPPVFSRHEKLRGDHLPPEAYGALSEAARDRLGAVLGQFYAQIHAVPKAAAREAGARRVQPWLPAQEIARLALPRLPKALQGPAEVALAAYASLPRDPLGQVYGFFDGHGWNMAFDFARGALTGIFDFADSGIGDLHREFVYPSLISPDLTARIITEYDAQTGRRIDRARVALLTGAHRLWELATAGDDLAAMQANARDWFGRGPGPANG